MLKVVILYVLVLASCVGLAIVGSRLRGKHKRGATAARLCIGVPVMAIYTYGVLAMTLIGRTVSESRKAKLELFWSHRESLALAEEGLSVTNASLLAEIVLNVLLFVPFGVILPFLFPKFMRLKATWGAGVICLAASVCSLAIELAQWRFKLGLFEFDDVLHNTLGALLGYAIYRLVFRLSHSRGRKSPKVVKPTNL